MTSVIRVWCEYDLDEVTSSHVYTELPLARQAVFNKIHDMGFTESMEELEDNGYLSFEWLDVIDC